GLAYSLGVPFGEYLPAATSFLMPINLGASFNMRLVYHITSVISTKTRAFNNENRAEDTVAVALHTGTDLNCSDFYLKHKKEALDNKTIVEKDTDRALEHTFNVLIRLGLFDPPEQPFYRQLTKADVDTPKSRKLSLESTQ
ncbi:unnamed protein product, partial [Rotaria sp. Silwood2]